VLDIVFAMRSDDWIADTVCVRIVHPQVTPSGSCARRLLKLTERGRPFSLRLRRTIALAAVQWLWRLELNAADLEFVCLLKNLKVGVGEVGNANMPWLDLLMDVLRSPMGRGRLSSHYWFLLGNLVPMAPTKDSGWDRDTEIMESLEEAQDWEKLETRMLVVWWFEHHNNPVPIQDIGRATVSNLDITPTTTVRHPKIRSSL
jgi:hypothetical protein